jgi:hypothetical protein
MLSPLGIKIVSGLVITGFGLLYARKWVQGYWWDKYCTSKKDLTGQTALVTGGNSGVGFETALDLAGRNANVVIACRNEQRAKVVSVGKGCGCSRMCEVECVIVKIVFFYMVYYMR